MTFQPVLSEKLERVLSKLAKKNKMLVIAVNKKIKQICSCDIELMDHYKNLKQDLSDYKRVHVSKSFVLLFKVDSKKGLVFFTKLAHHDDIYKR
ncbi:MAG: addiction module toxin RelE [archaeon]